MIHRYTGVKVAMRIKKENWVIEIESIYCLKKLDKTEFGGV